MQITIMNYANEKKSFDIDLDKVAVITLTIVTGDEILDVINKDYSRDVFCSDYARENYFDGSYTLYDITKDINLLNDEKWLNRKNSYDYY